MAVTARGLIGTGSAGTAGTTITVTNTTGAVIPAGTFIHITGCWDNINSVTAPTITSSTVGSGTATANHATAIGSGQSTTAGSGVWHQCFRVLTTATIASGATIATLTSNQSAVKRAAHAEGFDNCTTTLRGTVTTATSTTGVPSVTTTGTALVIGDLVIGSASAENNAQMTADADTAGGAWPPIVGTFTTGGAANTNVVSSTQYKILTATGTQTFNPTGGVLDTVACVYSLVPVPDPTFTQAAYRLYADGTETGSTALAAQDTAYEADVSGGDVNLGLRVRVQSTNVGAATATDDWRLQWDKNTSGVWTNVGPGTETVADSYSETNQSTQIDLTISTGPAILGQTFLGDGLQLTKAGFYIKKTGTLTGNVVAELWVCDTGTFGTNASPSFGATPVATSAGISFASLGTTLAWSDFTFGGYALTAGTVYAVTARTEATPDVSNFVSAGTDNTSPSHAGNNAQRGGAGGWTGNNVQDVVFRVYTQSTTVVSYASANLTDSAATTNRLGAGTGSFSAGEVSEDGLVDDLVWTANNYTELLYSLTLKQANLADGDTLTFRVVRNGLTAGFTYSQTPTIDIGGGVPTVTGTALITQSVTITVDGVPTTYGTALVTQAATVDVTGVRTTFGTALIEITGNTSATVGGVTITGTAAIATAVTIDVAGTVTAEVVTGTALIASAVTVDVAGTVVAEIVTGTALLTQSVAIDAAGVPTTFGTALLTQSATIDVTGIPTTYGTAALTQSVDVTAAGVPTVYGTALVTQAVETTAVGATAGVTVGTAALTQAVTVTVLGTTVGAVPGTAILTQSAAVTATGLRTVNATAALTEAVTTTAAGATTARTILGIATVTASAALTVAGTRVVAGTATLEQSATVTVTAVRVVYGTVAVGWSVVITALVITYYDDTHPHTGTWTLTYMATYALTYTATLDRRYTASWDCTAPSGTWDIDHSGTWELV